MPGPRTNTDEAFKGMPYAQTVYPFCLLAYSAFDRVRTARSMERIQHRADLKNYAYLALPIANRF
jgi:hypothetical protein